MSPAPGLHGFPTNLSEGLAELYRETEDPALDALRVEMLQRSEDGEARPVRVAVESLRDRLSTRLMDAFRLTQSPLAFGLLYELNYRLFLGVISSRLRRFYFSLDPQDVLQEVFFNIYRYPHKFKADKDQAFRHWASMIIRNTVYKCTRERDRDLTHEMHDEEIDTRADVRHATPLGDAIRVESERICSRSYLIYLQLYLAAYQQLSQREKRALHLVECDGRPYKEAAEELSIRLENLKMVIFRARKKILRTLDCVLASAEAWQPGVVPGGTADEDDAGEAAESRRSPILTPARRLSHPVQTSRAVGRFAVPADVPIGERAAEEAS